MAMIRARDLGVSFTDDGRLLVRAPMRGAAARVPPFAIELLSFCALPRTRDDVERRYGGQAARMFDDLVSVGILVDEVGAAATPAFFANFASLDVHRRMLADRPRVDGYARAIAEVVKPGMAVMDCGTGSGVLAALAALAGARVVYAVDNSDVLDLAVEVFAATGIGDRVRPVRGDFAHVVLPEKVDVIVTETFGAFGLAEDGLTDVASAAANNLAPGGTVLPRAMDLWIAPVTDRALLDEAVEAFAPKHGVVLTPLRDAAWTRGITREIASGSLGAVAQRIGTATLGARPDVRGQVAFDVSAEIVGWAGWFDLDMGSFTLSTGPAAPMTHWKQQFLPVAPFRSEDRLVVDVSLAPPADDRRGIEVTCTWPTGRSWHRLR